MVDAIWIPQTKPEQRVQAVCFRREFSLSQVPAEAWLQSWSSGRYLLTVNDAVVASGPMRAYPEHPVADRWNLASFLQPGTNRIEVLVVHSPVHSKSIRRTPAAMRAWGRIADPAGSIELATPGDWRCRLLRGYDPDAVAWSFTLPPCEWYDARCDAEESDWQQPCILDQETTWGPLRERQLPAQWFETVAPRRTHACARLRNDEVAWAWSVPFYEVGSNEHVAPAGHPALCDASAFASLRIHSPVRQTVPVRAPFAQHWLNGHRCGFHGPQGPRDRELGRIDLPVEAGWNELFVRFDRHSTDWHYLEMVPQHWHHVVLAPLSAQLQMTDLRLGRPLPWVQVEHLLRVMDHPPCAEHDWSTRWMDAAFQQPAPMQAVEATRPAAPIAVPMDRIADWTLPAGDVELIVDFGGTRFGHIELDWTAPAGTRCCLAVAEQLHAGRPRQRRNGNQTAGTDAVISAGRRMRWRGVHPRGFRYLHLVVQGHGTAVEIHALRLHTRRYPHASSGAFNCDRPELNRLWQRAETTLHWCSDDVYVDTPWREQACFGGDTFVDAAIALVSSGDRALGKHCTELMTQGWSPSIEWMQCTPPMRRSHPTPLVDYPLLGLLLGDWLLALGSDAPFVSVMSEGFLPLMQQMLRWCDADDLITPPFKPFIDHRPTGLRTDGGPVAALQAIAALSCDAYARCCERSGGDASDWRQQAARLRAAGQCFWDVRAQAFADARDAHGTVPAWHLVTQAWCLLADVASPEQICAIRQRIETACADPQAVRAHRFGTPYGAFFLLAACYQQGWADLAEVIMQRQWQDNLADDADTLWENLGGDASRSHAWSGGAAYLLSTQVLGVGLGFPQHWEADRLVLQPCAHGLRWARGIVPHPAGPVHVHWWREHERLHVQWQAPAGLTVTVRPRGRLAGLELVESHVEA
ncbi:MAG: family 78 glycoside hydrolase catalytic domain [Planctomycetota bacterium]